MALATKHSLLLLGILVFFISLSAYTKPAMADDDDDDIPADFSRKYFPDGFIFGTATSAYQIEGAANKSGRGPSVWDTFTHETPERILDHSNGDIAVDFYHHFREDIKNVKNMGFDAFRFSISWTRIIPSGRRREGVNQEGIDFYNDVINEIIKNDLKPFVTIFHWDTPQALEDKYGGFLSSNIVGFAYDDGIFAPGRCSYWVNYQCPAGNSATEPYVVAHHLLLAHAAAVQVYREKYKKSQNGQIGITLFTFWFEPLSNRTVDIEASKTALDFMFGLWMDPLTYVDPEYIRYKTDSHVNVTAYDYDGNLIGPQAYSPWFYIFPKGVDNANNETESIDDALKDQFRIDYYRMHLWKALESLNNYTVNVKGYFAWSYLDNFEWNIGYTSRFGLYYVDYKDSQLKRYAKHSATWFHGFLNNALSKITAFKQDHRPSYFRELKEAWQILHNVKAPYRFV
ncbi:hypothetical protein GH714_015263 [Hevea brasiliensis]|uniref:Beta-glucosidase n=1 Tax=Hevea brasiliensis TaxID=3981 RepID=A0A6A6MZW5_HEVBR|nr:hypothetical protein GH714_015263 [Hevea brasiliensis]